MKRHDPVIEHVLCRFQGTFPTVQEIAIEEGVYTARIVPGEPKLGAQVSDLVCSWDQLVQIAGNPTAVEKGVLIGWSSRLQAPAITFCEGVQFRAAFHASLQAEKAWSLWKSKLAVAGGTRPSGDISLQEGAEWCARLLDNDGEAQLEEQLREAGWSCSLLLGDTARLVLTESKETDTLQVD